MKKPKILNTAFATYNVLRSVGQGGNGFVYEVEEDDSRFAIKVLDPARATREKLKRFENEYRFCSSERHKNIIRVIDHGIANDEAPFFVMPLYEGSLRDLIGTLDEDACYSVFVQILDGIEAAHKYDVTHRDLKPENILYRNAHSEIVLADFGIAEFGEDDLYTAVETKDSTRLANFQYAAPEQRVRNGKISKATDIYALGLIVNELFTGELALGKNHKEISDTCEKYAYLNDVIERMLQQSPADRYGNIEEIKKDISSLSKQYISSLKISELDNTVIPEHEVDDAIINDPMKIVSIDWDNGMLKIHLNHQPTYQWQWALQNMGGHSSLMGKGPEMFRFNGATTSIAARDEREAQAIINHFKQWLPRVAQVYENKLTQDAKSAEQEKINEIRKKREAEERKKTINANLTF
ncbi:MAG: serine/threonine protein kinase [Candidatus Thiodiazotropha sp. (ex Troendleina suluensis)]|nr:serine/threonine protein kinase [Candidatus Thiodiazotropha sp. (ex Troendleina suluensis)]